MVDLVLRRMLGLHPTPYQIEILAPDLDAVIGFADGSKLRLTQALLKELREAARAEFLSLLAQHWANREMPDQPPPSTHQVGMTDGVDLSPEQHLVGTADM